VLGAGNLTTSGGGDQTVIVDNSATAASNALLNVVTNSNPAALVRIAGLTFETGSGQIKYNGVLGFNGNSANIRVDHSHFQMSTGSTLGSGGLGFFGCVFGVVDHNIFDGSTTVSNNEIRASNAGQCYSDSQGLGDQA
jgi:hypothetical protein